MQRIRILAAVVAAIVGLMLGVNPALGATSDVKTSGMGLGPFPYAPDEVLVKFNTELPTTAWLNAFGAATSLEATDYLADIHWYLFKIRDQMAVPQKIAALKRMPGVEEVSANGGGEAAFTPNDPYYGDQWYLPRMEVPQAWDHLIAGQGDGGVSVKIAIVDTGVYDNSDLGYVHHYNWTSGSDVDTCGSAGHGTMMAGIAAAAASNSNGIAGVAYASPIYSEKVIVGCSTVYSSWVSNGITAAVNHGAQAINASFVVSDSAAVRDAVDYAWNSGALVSAATGNDGQSNFNGYAPAMYVHANAVGGTQHSSSECRDPESNYGSPGVDVVAPSRDIWSTNRSGSVTHWGTAGTSSATALVTGVVALMYDHYVSITPSSIKSKLHLGANHVCGQSGYSSQLGYGRVNAYYSVTQHY